MHREAGLRAAADVSDRHPRATPLPPTPPEARILRTLGLGGFLPHLTRCFGLVSRVRLLVLTDFRLLQRGSFRERVK